MDLRVKDVERIVVQVPYRDRARPWLEIMVAEWAIVEICRVTCNVPGIVGYGETVLYYSWESVTDSAVARVIGQNPVSLLSDDSLGEAESSTISEINGTACHLS